MNQNYIKIFENEAGNITIQYGMAIDNDQSIDVSTTEIHIDDLEEIGRHLINLGEEYNRGK